jgi:hypothetical protein
MSNKMAIKTGHGIGLLLAIIGIVAIFLYVLPRTGSILYAIIANTVVGFIVIFLVNGLFGLGITYDLLVFVFVAIFGLFGVAILIIMNLLGFKR